MENVDFDVKTKLPLYYKTSFVLISTMEFSPKVALKFFPGFQCTIERLKLTK